MGVVAFSYEMQTSMLTSRGVLQISNACNRLTMTEHKIKRLPLRFEVGPLTRAGGLLGYAPRSAKYQKAKAKKHHHQKPNVWTGELRDRVLASAKVTATATQGRLTARGTRSSNLREKRREEIEAIAATERDDMVATWRETFLTLAQRSQYKRTERKRNQNGQFAS